MLGMAALMINSSSWNKIHYNLFQPERGPDPKLDRDILNVRPIKQEISSKGFSSFLRVRDTAEGFTKLVLQYVFIFCKLQTQA